MADKESTRLYNQAYYQAHRAYIRECQRRRYAEDAAFKAAMLERRRRYHVANRERENARTNEYNITHRAALRLQQRTRRLKHIARIRIRERAHTLARRAMARGAFVEHIDPVFVFARDGGICGICTMPINASDKWHVDHIVPLAKGGRHAYDNVQIAHALCNLLKGARHEAHHSIAADQMHGFL